MTVPRYQSSKARKDSYSSVHQDLEDRILPLVHRPRTFEVSEFADATLERDQDQLESARLTVTPGANLGPYEILNRIGEGGMGVVYRARDPRLDRQVAIKLLTPLSAAVRARERLRREAMADRRDRPPLHLQDLRNRRRRRCAVPGDGVHRGNDAASAAVAGPNAAARSLARGRRNCGSPRRSARPRFLHRDLKPANVMLTQQGHVR